MNTETEQPFDMANVSVATYPRSSHEVSSDYYADVGAPFPLEKMLRMFLNSSGIISGYIKVVLPALQPRRRDSLPSRLLYPRPLRRNHPSPAGPVLLGIQHRHPDSFDPKVPHLHSLRTVNPSPADALASCTVLLSVRPRRRDSVPPKTPYLHSLRTVHPFPANALASRTVLLGVRLRRRDSVPPKTPYLLSLRRDHLSAPIPSDPSFQRLNLFHALWEASVRTHNHPSHLLQLIPSHHVRLLTHLTTLLPNVCPSSTLKGEDRRSGMHPLFLLMALSLIRVFSCARKAWFAFLVRCTLSANSYFVYVCLYRSSFPENTNPPSKKHARSKANAPAPARQREGTHPRSGRQTAARATANVRSKSEKAFSGEDAV
jgi:hypothetical protein